MSNIVADIRALSTAVWAGFAPAAVEKLAQIDADTDELRVKHQIAWLLARKSFADGQYEDTLAQLRRCAETATRRTDRLSLAIMTIETLRLLGRIDEAQATATEASAGVSEEPRLILALAALSLSGDERLGHLNRLLSLGGAEMVAVGVPEDAITIHNLVRTSDHHRDGPKVSVVMPAYNAGPTIATAIRGILNQSWRNVELLIVDDASTDDTWDVISALAHADNRIVPMRVEQNAGAYNARNLGLANASGEFMTVNDADDWSHPQRIEFQMEALLSNPSIPLNTSYGIRCLEDLTPILNPKNVRQLIENFSSLLAPTRLMRELGGWDRTRFAADSDLYARLLQHTGAERAEPILNMPLAFILSRPESLTRVGATSLSSNAFGARRQYREAGSYWHSIATSLTIHPDRRSFPVPRIAVDKTETPIELDDLIISDFSTGNETNLRWIERALTHGRRFGLFHLPRLMNCGSDVDVSIRKLVHDNWLPMIVAGEAVQCERALVVDPACLGALPDLLPIIDAKRALLADPATEGYDYEAVMANGEALLGKFTHVAACSDLDEVLQSEEQTQELRSSSLSTYLGQLGSVRLMLSKAQADLDETQARLEGSIVEADLLRQKVSELQKASIGGAQANKRPGRRRQFVDADHQVKQLTARIRQLEEQRRPPARKRRR